MKAKFALAVVAFLCALALSLAAQDATKPDSEGFIRDWLILAPIPYEGEDNGAVEIAREQIKGEAAIQPKAGDKVTIEKKEYVWAVHKAKDYFIDFAGYSGKGPTEDVIGYAVAYVVADAETNVMLKFGSNDQARVYLNGKTVFTFDDTRTLEKDQNEVAVTLNKGVNTVVFKVINQKNSWQGCLRFTDKSGKPITNLKVQLNP